MLVPHVQMQTRKPVGQRDKQEVEWSEMVSGMLRNKVASLIHITFQSTENPSFHIVPALYGFSCKGFLWIKADPSLSTIFDWVLASVNFSCQLNIWVQFLCFKNCSQGTSTHSQRHTHTHMLTPCLPGLCSYNTFLTQNNPAHTIYHYDSSWSCQIIFLLQNV